MNPRVPDPTTRGEVPPDLRPMLAVPTTSIPGHDDAWAFEMKWDGMRALLGVHDGRLRVTSRRGNDVTASFPELEQLGPALSGRSAVLDGEIVVLDDRGRPSFERLQPRIHARSERGARRLAEAAPCVVMLFDVLWLDGPVAALPYTARRELLADLHLAGPSWQTPPWRAGGGPGALASALELGFEGIVMKRLGGAYLAGRRSDLWRTMKLERRQELVVGGWIPGKAGLAGRLGSLLVGTYDATGALRYAGRVGSGIAASARDLLEHAVSRRTRPTSPFADAPRLPEPHWVEPELVVEVAFHEWTRAGILRAPRYKGLRTDKVAREVTRER